MESSALPIIKVISFPPTKTNPNWMKLNITKVELGRGAFGTVYLALDSEDSSRAVAVKHIDRKLMKDDRDYKNVVNEIKILREIRSSYVVGLIEATQTPNSFYVAMEMCNGGDLDNFRLVRGNGFLPEREARIIIK